MMGGALLQLPGLGVTGWGHSWKHPLFQTGFPVGEKRAATVSPGCELIPGLGGAGNPACQLRTSSAPQGLGEQPRLPTSELRRAGAGFKLFPPGSLVSAARDSPRPHVRLWLCPWLGPGPTRLKAGRTPRRMRTRVRQTCTLPSSLVLQVSKTRGWGHGLGTAFGSSARQAPARMVASPSPFSVPLRFPCKPGGARPGEGSPRSYLQCWGTACHLGSFPIAGTWGSEEASSRGAGLGRGCAVHGSWSLCQALTLRRRLPCSLRCREYLSISRVFQDSFRGVLFGNSWEF